MRILKLTRKARRAMKAGHLGSLTADEQLVLEVVSRTPGAEVHHHDNLCASLLDHYGSAENALEAIKRGEVKFDKITP